MIFPVLNLRNYNRGEVKLFNDNDEETGESLNWDHWGEVGIGPGKAIDAGLSAATTTHPQLPQCPLVAVSQTALPACPTTPLMPQLETLGRAAAVCRQPTQSAPTTNQTADSP